MRPVIEVRDVSKSFRIPSVRRDTVREHVFGAFERRGYEELRVLDASAWSCSRARRWGSWAATAGARARCSRSSPASTRRIRARWTLRAPITPILELGVGWNPELDAIDNVFLIGSVMGLSLARGPRAARRDPRVRRAGAVREPEAEALLQRHGGAAGLRDRRSRRCGTSWCSTRSSRLATRGSGNAARSAIDL